MSTENTPDLANIESNANDHKLEKLFKTITKKQLVPHCIKRPQVVYKTYSQTMPYQFIIFDLETSDTGSKAEICQLSAITQTGSMYSSYIMPKSNISPGASRVNNFTVENLNGTKSLCKNSVPVAAMSLENALSSFIKFIQQT